MTTNTTNTIRLRNKCTGLYYVDGGCFSADEASATIIERDSAKHIMIRHSFVMDNVEEIEVKAAAEKPVFVSGGRGLKTYKYKGYTIEVSRWSERSYAYGTSRTRSGTQFFAYGNGKKDILEGGGIKRAKQIIDSIA